MYDIVLTVPVRAAAASEITQMANLIRAKDPSWAKRDWQNEVSILSNWRTEPAPLEAALRAADVVLAFKNKTCDLLNPYVRELRGLTAVDDPTRPTKGDWLLAWQADAKEGIGKSERYEVLHATPRPGSYVTRLRSEDGAMSLVAVSKPKLQQQQSSLKLDGCLEFSYGHVITAHKSQGGEWPRVVVFAGDKTRSHVDFWNWLYTAVTRAKVHLTIMM